MVARKVHSINLLRISYIHNLKHYWEKPYDRQDPRLTHGFCEQYKTLKNSEKYRFHKRSWDWHAWLSLREEVYKCDLKFYITHEQVFNVITLVQFVYELDLMSS